MAVAVTRTDYLPRVDPRSRSELVRLSPDRKQVAFVRTIGWVASVCVTPVRERSPSTEDDAWRGLVDEDTVDSPLAAAEGLVELVRPEAGPVVDLEWSPDGAYLAYRMAGAPPGIDDEIGWVRADEPGELGRSPGTAFSWAPRRPALYVADPGQYVLRRVAVEGGKPRELAELIHYRNPRFWPQVEASPDGSRIAYTTRDERDETTRVWLVEAGDDGPQTSLVTWIPGVDLHAYLAWSHKGVSLALFVVHEQQHRSGLIVLKQLRGEGKIWYQHEALDGPAPPAWAPDGRSFSLFRRAGPKPAADERNADAALVADPYDPKTIPTGAPGQLLGNHALVRLDLATGDVAELAPAGALQGTPRYLDDERLLIDGGRTAHVLQLQVADDG